jgi:predicted amidohydrolase YtcJ
MVGDRAIEVVFDAMEAMTEIDWPAQRVRIEHGDGVDGDLVERFGPDRLFSRFRSLIDAGIPVAIGSDGPPNPWLDVMLAAVHPLHPSEGISVEEAVVASTLGAAFAEDREQVKGSIAVGKLADLAVLSQDVFTIPVSQIVATRSLLTMVGGEIVYDSGDTLEAP